ncbi:AraC family transcriptional regulator [Telluribacter sp. SYSU D00476]|uniref:helix-turn-helix domain-containing protein n=1 Tax=Telluribacter sp. SYSU D00476 TaxID=2811430 RepID=UPI001FF36FBE|nr:AraC family transcriptional regulator [Telluribacter sp. SYSU D00476]
MKDDVYNLPDSLIGGSSSPDASIHFYATAAPSVKNKVVFSQNLICILIHGTKEVFTSTSYKKISHDEIFFLNAGSVLMSERVPGNSHLESILIFFSNQFLTDFCIRHKVHASQKAGEPHDLITIGKDPFLHQFEVSLKLMQQESLAELQKIKVEELLMYLQIRYPTPFGSFVSQALTSSPEQRIRQVIAANVDKGLSSDELAFLCNMSVSTFKRHFTHMFNTSPRKYLIEQRMQRAWQLLMMGRRASEIYAELGYENLSSFSTEFKKHFGLSPKSLLNS